MPSIDFCPSAQDFSQGFFFFLFFFVSNTRLSGNAAALFVRYGSAETIFGLCVGSAQHCAGRLYFSFCGPHFSVFSDNWLAPDAASFVSAERRQGQRRHTDELAEMTPNPFISIQNHLPVYPSLINPSEINRLGSELV